MPRNCQPILDLILRAAPSQEHYTLHLAALEWSLAEAIVIQSTEDIRSRVKWQGKFDPFKHQVDNLFTFCRRLPVTLLTDDVGLGKTISAGLILSELMVRRRVRRALVLCPSILCPQWVEELGSKFGIDARPALGKQLVQELQGQTPVVVSTYETASKYLKEIKPDAFEMLILDEAHKLRNLYGGSKPPALAVNVRLALAQRLFKYVVMLTATPIHNRLWDLYSLIDCLTIAKGHKNPFGMPEQFKQKYLLPGYDGRRLQNNLAVRTAFHGFVREYLVRTRRRDARLKFPGREVKTCSVELPESEVYLAKLVGNHIGHLNALQQISLAQALMSSPHALATQLEGMAESGSIPRAVADEARTIVGRIGEPAKLQKLLTILEELILEKPQDWRVVVFTLRKETQKLIGGALQRRGIKFGFVEGGAAGRNKAAIDRLATKPPGIHVLVSTDAGAEGVNLQAANFLVNYDLPWNPMTVEQRIGRIQRLGSEHEYVIVCNLVAANSAEKRVVCRLMEKLQGIAEAIGDIESILESTEGDEKEEAGERFASQIRRLVVQSLMRQDVEKATRLAEESIEKARQTIEQQRHELDIALGRADGVDPVEPRMPCLKRVSPSLPSKDFVLRAKRANGAHVEERTDGTWVVNKSGRILEVIEFEEGDSSASPVFMGNVQLYEPGRQAFERLVQHWLDHYGHFVRDLRSKTAAQAEALARVWCQTIPESEFQAGEIQDRQSFFQGRARLRVKANNGVDSYEKLLWEQFRPQGHSSIQLEDGVDDVVRADIRLQEIIPDVSASVARVAEADTDVVKFCEFYEQRCQEEMKRAEGDQRRENKIRSDFTPSIVADIVGLEGIRYEEVTIRVQFTIEGEGPYEAKLSAIPASGQILQEPPKVKCAVTDLSVPEDCLDVCSVSHVHVLRHRLMVSEWSGKRGLPHYAIKCAVTNKTVFTNEVETSAVSGRTAIADLFRRSPVSGRLGLSDEFESCRITGKEVLQEELIFSEVSGERFNKYEAVRSAVSGKIGHCSEFLLCAKTGAPISPEESGTSAYSGKVVRRDLLRPSENPSHRLGLEEELDVCSQTGKRLLLDELGHSAVSDMFFDLKLMAKCDKTGALALPRELEECSLGGGRVLPRLLETCAVTGQRALPERMLRSAVSGKYVLLTRAIHSAVSDEVGLPDEMVRCAWLQKPILRREAGACKLTRMKVAACLLNKSGELSVLRELLDGRAKRARTADDMIPILRSLNDGAFRGLRHAWIVSSPEGKRLPVCGELRSFLGFRVRHVGFLLRNEGERHIIGRYSIGSRTSDGWSLKEQH